MPASDDWSGLSLAQEGRGLEKSIEGALGKSGEKRKLRRLGSRGDCRGRPGRVRRRFASSIKSCRGSF